MTNKITTFQLKLKNLNHEEEINQISDEDEEEKIKTKAKPIKSQVYKAKEPKILLSSVSYKEKKIEYNYTYKRNDEGIINDFYILSIDNPTIDCIEVSEFDSDFLFVSPKIININPFLTRKHKESKESKTVSSCQNKDFFKSKSILNKQYNRKSIDENLISKQKYIENICFNDGIKVKKILLSTQKDIDKILSLEPYSNKKTYFSLLQISPERLERYFLIICEFLEVKLIHNLASRCEAIISNKSYVICSTKPYFKLFNQILSTIIEDEKCKFFKILNEITDSLVKVNVDVDFNNSSSQWSQWEEEGAYQDMIFYFFNKQNLNYEEYISYGTYNSKSLYLTYTHIDKFNNDFIGIDFISTVFFNIPFLSSDIIFIISHLLLDQSFVFLVEDDDSIHELTSMILGFYFLIKPFEWEFTIIPKLSFELMSILESPIPFIIGVVEKSIEVSKMIESSFENNLFNIVRYKKRNIKLNNSHTCRVMIEIIKNPNNSLIIKTHDASKQEKANASSPIMMSNLRNNKKNQEKIVEVNEIFHEFNNFLYKNLNDSHIYSNNFEFTKASKIHVTIYKGIYHLIKSNFYDEIEKSVKLAVASIRNNTNNSNNSDNHDEDSQNDQQRKDIDRNSDNNSHSQIDDVFHLSKCLFFNNSIEKYSSSREYFSLFSESNSFSSCFNSIYSNEIKKNI